MTISYDNRSKCSQAHCSTAPIYDIGTTSGFTWLKSSETPPTYTLVKLYRCNAPFTEHLHEDQDAQPLRIKHVHERIYATSAHRASNDYDLLKADHAEWLYPSTLAMTLECMYQWLWGLEGLITYHPNPRYTIDITEGGDQLSRAHAT